MLKLKAQVLQFALNLVQSQTISQRRIDVKGLAGNLVLFVGRLTLQGAHIVQTVADLDDNHTDIIAHGEKKFLEVLGLCRSLLAKDTTADLGQTIHNLCDLGTKDILDVLYGIVGIFYHIVQQGCTDTG